MLLHRWRRDRVGGTCVLGRQSPGFVWRDDGSRVLAFELDPVHRFRPPAQPAYLRRFTTDPAIAPRWRAFVALMPSLFHRYGDAWLSTEDGRTLGCSAADYPDAFHTDAACSARLRARLDAAARSRR